MSSCKLTPRVYIHEHLTQIFSNFYSFPSISSPHMQDQQQRLGRVLEKNNQWNHARSQSTSWKWNLKPLPLFSSSTSAANFPGYLCCKCWIKNCIVALGKICREYRVPWLCNDSRDWVTLLSSKFRKCMCENWIELNCWLCVPGTCSVFGLLVLVEVLKNVVGSDVLCAISRTVVVIKWSWFEYVSLQFLEFCVYWMPSWKYMHLDMWNMNLLIISCCVLVNCSGNISNTCTWARIEKLEFKEESNRNLQENPTLQLKIDL